MKTQRTELDIEYENTLKKCIELLTAINQKSIKEQESDIRNSSSYMVELLEMQLGNW
jgi:hypothetical protein